MNGNFHQRKFIFDFNLSYYYVMLGPNVVFFRPTKL